VTLNPPAQYADDGNLRARQRFWEQQSPAFAFVGWVLDLARLSPGLRVLDAGCGNGWFSMMSPVFGNCRWRVPGMANESHKSR
jgi:cyclopropane fatty-acyl-phospholipid synthase-like methyltransferase